MSRVPSQPDLIELMLLDPTVLVLTPDELLGRLAMSTKTRIDSLGFKTCNFFVDCQLCRHNVASG